MSTDSDGVAALQATRTMYHTISLIAEIERPVSHVMERSVSVPHRAAQCDHLLLVAPHRVIECASTLSATYSSALLSASSAAQASFLAHS